jgi:LPS sulfotransferase NodH
VLAHYAHSAIQHKESFMGKQATQRYAIMSTPRSGSSHLVFTLEAHPDVACLGEIFNTHGGAMRRLGIKSKQMIQMCANEPLQYLEEVTKLWEEREDAKPVFGFKMMLHHDPRVIEHIVSNADWKIILLRRQNVLAQWSSLQIAKVTGEWGSKKKKMREKAGIEEPTTRIEFKAKTFENYDQKLETRYGAISKRLTGHQLFEVATEEIDKRRDEILAFLAVDPSQAKPAPGVGERQNSKTLEDRFTNYDDVVAYAKEHGLSLTA